MRKMNNIIVNFTPLSDIDIRKPKSKSDAAHVIYLLFLFAGLSVGFSSGNRSKH